MLPCEPDQATRQRRAWAAGGAGSAPWQGRPGAGPLFLDREKAARDAAELEERRAAAVEARRAARRVFVPKSVHLCGGPEYRLTTWRRDGTGEPETEPFRCRSWRCARCRSAVAFQDYARIAQGISTRDVWVYVVLTLPAEARRLSLWDRFNGAKAIWRGPFRKALARRWGPSVYVQTWEAHRDGTPHLNLCLSGPAASAMIAGGSHGRVLNVRSELRDMAVRSGFGPVLWVEPAWTPREGAERPLDGLASYLVKCWAALGGSGPLKARGKLAAELARAEAKHGDQTPVGAPPRFRRFSASPRLLPPRLKGDVVTGLVHENRGRSWTWQDVERWERRRERASVRLLEVVERLELSGFPVPAWADRIVRHGQDKTVSGEGALPSLRRENQQGGHAVAQQDQAPGGGSQA